MSINTCQFDPEERWGSCCILPREIITGKKLYRPKYKIGQYMQGHLKSTNDTGKERSIDGLYLGPADNGCRHSVFTLQTEQPISVPRVTPIPITKDITNRVNQLGKEEGEEEDIVCTYMFGNATLDDLDYNAYDANDDDSNASDENYEFNDDAFDTEIDEENKLDDEHGIGDEEVQADYFANHDSESELENDEGEPENQEVENQEVENKEVENKEVDDTKGYQVPISDNKSSQQCNDGSGQSNG